VIVTAKEQTITRRETKEQIELAQRRAKFEKCYNKAKVHKVPAEQFKFSCGVQAAIEEFRGNKRLNKK
jgi:hypothetical protein